LAGTLLLSLTDVVYFNLMDHIPSFGEIWWLALWIPAFAAAAATAWAGGATLPKRIVMSLLCGALIGLFYAVSNALLGYFAMPNAGEAFSILQLLVRMAPRVLWRIFVFMILAVIGSFIAETRPIKAS
jgi:hypothetical protein